MNVTAFSRVLLRGASQTMLQRNSLTGALFLAALFFNSPIVGMGALTGVFSATLVAFLYGLDGKHFSDGVFGFNGALLGIALSFFFEPSFILFLLIMLGSAVSAFLTALLLRIHIPPYTFPFVVLTWILIYFSSPLVSARALSASLPDYAPLSSLVLSFGQVMLQDNVLVGLVFFIALLISSRAAAFYGLLGSSLGVLIGYAFSFPSSLTTLGILGYNGVLCGIAFSAKKEALLFALLSIFLSIPLLLAFYAYSLPALTAPFVLATWLALLLQRIVVGKA